MNSLIEQYEFLILSGFGIGYASTMTAYEIYKTLINQGKLCEELREIEEIMDVFLVDVEYRFSREIVLEALAEEIRMISIVDELKGLRVF